MGNPVFWDREVVITAGFSYVDATTWCPDFGAYRSHEGLVWHDMEGYLNGALARWNTGAAGADICILRDGTIVLVRGGTEPPLQAVMWQAGTNGDPSGGTLGRTAFWRGHNINAHSHGVELEGYAATGYTPQQIAAVRKVSRGMHARFGIAMQHTIDQFAGQHLHMELSAMRGDPGPTWNWQWPLG